MLPQNFDIWLVLPHSKIKCDFVFDSASIEVENKLKWLAGSLLQDKKKRKKMTRFCTQNENLKRFLPCFLFRCIPVWKKHTQSNWADVRDMPEWRVLHTQQAAPSIMEPVNKMIWECLKQTEKDSFNENQSFFFLFCTLLTNCVEKEHFFFFSAFTVFFSFLHSHRNRSKL